MNIRLANIEDAESLAKHNVLLANESENMNISYKTALKGVKAILTDSGKGFYLVAEKNDIIIGELMITFEWSDWRSKNMWWIQSVYIKENYRKKGVFRKLVEEIKKMALKNNVDLIRLYVYGGNEKAMKAYAGIGMKKTSYKIYELLL
jgi:GNAT superfamily N-acetyltransferase